jgi:hypothetical protein
MRGAWLLALVLASSVLAQEGGITFTKVIRIKLSFSDGGIAMKGAERDEGFAYPQYGIPQFAPLFYEIVGTEQEVLYAGELGDPRQQCHAREQGPGVKPVPRPEPPKEATLEVTVPDLEGASEIVVYRRTSDDPESGRTEKMRGKL